MRLRQLLAKLLTPASRQALHKLTKTHRLSFFHRLSEHGPLCKGLDAHTPYSLAKTYEAQMTPRLLELPHIVAVKKSLV